MKHPNPVASTGPSLALALALAVALGLGCGGGRGDDVVYDRCRRLMSAICGEYAACHVVERGVPFTPALCAELQAGATDNCVAEGGFSIAAATDEIVDACAAAFAATPCTSVCGQLPPVPEACTPLDLNPGTTAITCQ